MRKIRLDQMSLKTLVTLTAAIFLICATSAVAASPQTFYAHSEAAGYEANDNKMDQAPGEPNAATYEILMTGAGDFQIPARNAAGGRYFTSSWTVTESIGAGTWNFHTWIKSTGGAPTYYVKVFKNISTTPLFTSSSAAMGNGWSEVNTTGSAPTIALTAGDRLRYEYWVHLATTTVDKNIGGTSTNTVAGTTNPNNALAQDGQYAILTDGSAHMNVAGFDGTDLGTITGATVNIVYKGTGTTKNDTYEFDYTLDGTNWTVGYTSPKKSSPPVSPTTLSFATSTVPTWSQIANMQVRTQLNRQGGNPDVFTVDVDYIYVTLSFKPKVAMRVDDTSTANAGTRVDTTVTHIIPSLGWYLVIGLIIIFIFFAVRRGVLRVSRDEV